MTNQQEVQFYVYNIRLLIDRPRTPGLYFTLFRRLFAMNKSATGSKRQGLLFHTMKRTHCASIPVLKGHLCRFIKPVNIRSQTAAPARFPHYQVNEYLFIPAIHRLCLIAGDAPLPLTTLRRLLEEGLNNAAQKEEEVHVTLEKSPDFLDDLLNAPHISDIKFRISYSNQDLNDEYTNLLDSQLRDAEIEYLQISGRAREGKSVELQKSTFLMGAAGLVPSNGHATARIVNRDGYPRGSEPPTIPGSSGCTVARDRKQKQSCAVCCKPIPALMKHSSHSHPINIKRLRARHQSGPAALVRLYPKGKLKQTLGIPVVVTSLLLALMLWTGTPVRGPLLDIMDLAVRIFPDILGVLLGGFAIFFGFRDNAFLTKTTIRGEGPLTLYQKVIFAFTFTLVLQSVTLGTAFLFRLLAQVHIAGLVPAYGLINTLGFGVLLLLILISLFSIYQMVMIIFGLAQNYHLHLVLTKMGREKTGTNKESRFL